MVSMTKREKIIVSIMAATVLLGGYLYWGPVTTVGQQGVEKKSDSQALAFAQKVIQKLKADTSLTKDLFTIRSAERQWEKDPFLPIDSCFGNPLFSIYVLNSPIISENIFNFLEDLPASCQN